MRQHPLRGPGIVENKRAGKIYRKKLVHFAKPQKDKKNQKKKKRNSPKTVIDVIDSLRSLKLTCLTRSIKKSLSISAIILQMHALLKAIKGNITSCDMLL